jgi:uncharacterized protein
MIFGCLLVSSIVFLGSSQMQREAMWVSFDERIFEQVRMYDRGADGIIADGWIIHLGEKSYRIHYKIEYDADWRVRKLELTRWNENIETVRLRSNGKGHWNDTEGKSIPSLDGCVDVDIYASPFTNTLAIRRLALQQGEAETIQVAFVNLPDLKVVSVKVHTAEGRYETSNVPL